MTIGQNGSTVEVRCPKVHRALPGSIGSTCSPIHMLLVQHRMGLQDLDEEFFHAIAEFSSSTRMNAADRTTGTLNHTLSRSLSGIEPDRRTFVMFVMALFSEYC